MLNNPLTVSIGISLLVYVLIFVFVFKMLKSIKKKNSRIIDYADVEQAGETYYECPKCKQTMKNGYAFAGRGVFFRANEQKRPGPFMMINQCLDNTVSLSMGIKENRAWRCEKCKYVLIDHSALVGKTKKKI